MSYRQPIAPAPDYTNAALIMGGVNLFCAMLLFWAWLGYLAALCLAYGVHLWTRRLAARRGLA